jgi:Fe-S oxidoreductase
MTVPGLFPNHLAKERAAAALTPAELAERAQIDPALYLEIEQGRILPNHEELDRLTAALGDIEPARIYAYSLVNTIGDKRLRPATRPDYARFYDSMAQASHLLVAPDELAWLDRETDPAGARVDVFVNMSCSTQFVPHLMFNTINVLKALGVKIASGSGRLFCCGTYYRRGGNYDAALRMNAASVARGRAWGASTIAHFCTQCVNTFSEISHRHTLETGKASDLEHTQVLRLIDERLEELGDRVPWQKEVHAKVLAHGHSSYSFVHDRAKRDVGRIATKIPGVQFAGYMERISIDSFCDTEPGVPRRPPPRNREEVNAYREELIQYARSWGADTVSPSHQTCQQRWSPFSSDDVKVRHITSILAEALGCEAPDRHQSASRLGDAALIVEQTRPMWAAWAMTEEQALQIARETFDPAYATVDRCECGKSFSERCGQHGQQLITLENLTTSARG